MEIQTPEIPVVDLNQPGRFYKKTYRMNTVGRDGKTTTVAIPRDVLKRKAEEKGLSIDDFIATYQVIALYDNLDGVFLTFKERPLKDNLKE